MFDTIAFDADDTLWHTEVQYAAIIEGFKQTFLQYARPDEIEQTLNNTEMRNIEYYGYGVKGFALSLIEASIEIGNGRISGREILQVINLIKKMLTAEVRLIGPATQVVGDLANKYPLMIITKGDVFEQERKIAQSGLKPYFRYVEVVGDKKPDTYEAILLKYNIAPSRFMMVGNSLRSDILPVLALGGQAVHIPYPVTWIHENVPPSELGQQEYYELESLEYLPALIEEIENNLS